MTEHERPRPPHSRGLSQNWRQDMDAQVADESVPQDPKSLFFCPDSELGVPAGEVPKDLYRRAGDQLGDFVLLSFVGAGGMGQVWHARDTKLDRSVALKVIRPEVRSARTERMFDLEAKAAGKLSHPSIVRVLGAGEEGDIKWIVQEFVKGGANLAKSLHTLSPEDLPDDYDRKTAKFFLHLARALVEAHREGVVHRDLKPANILVLPNERPKLTDFGLARLFLEESAVGPSVHARTPGYASPEQVDPTSTFSETHPRVDVFSLGATLYHALALFPAFGEGSEKDRERRTIAGDKRPLEAHRPNVSPDLAAICFKAMETHPDDRYHDMRAFRDDLANYLDRRPVNARPLTTAYRAIAWIRRNHAAAALIGVLAAAVLVLVVLGLELAGTRQDKNDAQALLGSQLAQSSLEQGDWLAAIETMEAQIAAKPDDWYPHLLLGGLHAQLGRGTLAQEQVATAMKLGLDLDSIEDEGDRSYAKAMVLLAQERGRNTPAVEKHLAHAVTVKPELRSAWFPLFRARRDLKDKDGARVALTKAHSFLSVGSPFRTVMEVHDLRLSTSKEDDRPAQEAVALIDANWNSLIQTDEDEIYVTHLLGLLLLETGEYDRARRVLTAGTSLDPEHLDMRVNLALACVLVAESLTGEERAALIRQGDEAAREVLAVWPWSEVGLGVRARAEYLSFLDTGTALRGEPVVPGEDLPSISALKAQYPESYLTSYLSGAVHYGVARSLRGSDPDQALRCYDLCVQQRPDHFRAWVQAGVMLLGADQSAEALPYLDSAFGLWIEHGAGGPPDFTLPPESRCYWVREMLVARVRAAGQNNQGTAFIDSCSELRSLVEECPFSKAHNDQVQMLLLMDGIALSPLCDTSGREYVEALMSRFIQLFGEDPEGWLTGAEEMVSGVRSALGH